MGLRRRRGGDIELARGWERASCILGSAQGRETVFLGNALVTDWNDITRDDTQAGNTVFYIVFRAIVLTRGGQAAFFLGCIPQSGLYIPGK